MHHAKIVPHFLTPSPWRAVTLLFFLLLAFCAITRAAAPIAPPIAASSTRPAAPPALISMPSYGIAFIPPTGWTLLPLPPVNYVASWAKVDPTTHSLLAEINIEAHPTLDNETENFQKSARHQGAEILTQKFDVDREPAVAIRRDHRNSVGGPFLLLVAHHNDRTYEFQFYSDADALVSHEFIAFVKSIRWIPVEDPLIHVGALQETSIFKPQATIKLPSLFRMNGTSASDKMGFQRATFCVTDADSTLVALVSLTFLPAHLKASVNPDAFNTAAFHQQFLENARKSWEVDTAPTLDDSAPLSHGFITPLIKRGVFIGGRVVINQSRIGMMLFEVGTIQVSLTSFDRTAEDARKWDKVLLAVAQSIAFPESASSQRAPLVP